MCCDMHRHVGEGGAESYERYDTYSVIISPTVQRSNIDRAVHAPRIRFRMVGVQTTDVKNTWAFPGINPADRGIAVNQPMNPRGKNAVVTPRFLLRKTTTTPSFDSP